MDKTFIDIAAMIAPIAGTWFLIKYQVGELIKAEDEMSKKIDAIANKVTVLEQDTAHHIDLISAEQKFVTRREFELISKNLDKDLQLINKNIEELKEMIKNDK